MRERPIIMGADSVRAILAGTKSQTRRVVTCLGGNRGGPVTEKTGVLYWRPGEEDPTRWCGCDGLGSLGWVRCPYGVVGDRLWVREAWAGLDELADGTSPDPPQTIGYRADHTAVVFGAGLVPRPADTRHWNWEHSSVRWRPSIHMPRWASRLTLEIASVRVERVQSITEADARAEGVALGQRPCSYVGRCNSGRCPAHNYVPAFAALWDSINGARPGCSWADDPWVFAISFRRLRPGVESAVRAQMGMEGR